MYKFTVAYTYLTYYFYTDYELHGHVYVVTMYPHIVKYLSYPLYKNLCILNHSGLYKYIFSMLCLLMERFIKMFQINISNFHGHRYYFFSLCMNSHDGFWVEVFGIPWPIVVTSEVLNLELQIYGQFYLIGMLRRKGYHHSEAVCSAFVWWSYYFLGLFQCP